MHLNFTKLTNLSIDKGIITGQLDGKKVTVYRQSEGWRVGIRVVVEGHTIHSDMQPTDEDRKAYDDLDRRAWAEQDARRDAEKDALRPVTKQLYTLTLGDITKK